MADDASTREQLVHLLRGGNAHMSFDHAVADYPMEQVNTPFPNGTYTAWHLLEHIRRTQWDILDFMTNPNYKEIEWPREYWPAPDEQATAAEWQGTIDGFHRDMEALEEIVKNPETNLDAVIQHGDGQTMLREILLVADHNAYHTGEFAIMRQVMGTWGSAPH